MAKTFVHFELRRDTAAQWSSMNPILLEGEPGFETDTNKLKIGDGFTSWNSLAYFGGESLAATTGSILFGRGDSGAGVVQEITLGTNLSITGTTLNATGGGGGDCITCDEDFNIYAGEGALATAGVDTFENVVIGYNAVNLATEPFSTIAIGWQAMTATLTSSESIAIGWDSAGDLEDTSYDVFIGRSAGRGGGIGSSSFGNVGLGADSMNNVVSGGQNTCVGSWAGYGITDGWQNVLVGSNAGTTITTGEFNTLLGTDAGLDLDSGSNNIVIGYYSGHDIISGSWNILIGSQQQPGAAATSHKLAIDNDLPNAISNCLIYGEFDTRLVRTHGTFNVRYQTANAVSTDAGDSFRIDGSNTAGQTRMLVYDVDNATLERVTVGAADSGGAGFKVLRIPN